MSFSWTDKQKEARTVLTGEQRHTAIGGGSRSGKTFVLCQAVMARALRARGSRHLISRFRSNAAWASIGADTLPKVRDLCFPGIHMRERVDGYFEIDHHGSQIWISGLDEAKRVEKVLGQEFATIYANECSQIPYSSILILRTRLAQVVNDINGNPLKQRGYYDLNPPGKSHWVNQEFRLKKDPVSKKPLISPELFDYFRINPVDNRSNLDPAYLSELANASERHRKRFYEGEFVDEVDGALWTLELIERFRIEASDNAATRYKEAIEYGKRFCTIIVVAVDPSGAAHSEDTSHDAIGITVTGLHEDGTAIVLWDGTMLGGPAQWGRAAVNLYRDFQADRVVAEQNFGGEMVRFVIQAADANVPCKVVTASRGKAVRAEPVATLAEKGRVKHFGRHVELEDELCEFGPSGYTGARSPNRADAMIWGVSDLLVGEITTGIIEHYKREAEQITIIRDKSKRVDVITSKNGGTKLKSLTGGTTAFGMEGDMYSADADGCIVVKECDKAPLMRAGWIEARELEDAL